MRAENLEDLRKNERGTRVSRLGWRENFDGELEAPPQTEESRGKLRKVLHSDEKPTERAED